VHIPDKFIRLPKLVPEPCDEDILVNECVKDMHRNGFTDTQVEVLRKYVKLFTDRSAKSQVPCEFIGKSTYRRRINEISPLSEDFFQGFFENTIIKKKEGVSTEKKENNVSRNVFFSSNDIQNQNNLNVDSKNYNKEAVQPRRLSLKYHLAAFFASKENCEFVHLFPRKPVDGKVTCVSESDFFHRLYNKEKDCFVIVFGLYTDDFSKYGVGGPKARGVYGQILSGDAAFLELLFKTLFSFNVTDFGVHTLQELFEAILKELKEGEEKGFSVFHAGFNRYINIKIIYEYNQSDMLGRNEIMCVGGVTRHRSCFRCLTPYELFQKLFKDINKVKDMIPRTMKHFNLLVEKEDKDQLQISGYDVKRALSNDECFLKLTHKEDPFKQIQVDVMHTETCGDGIFIRHMNKVFSIIKKTKDLPTRNTITDEVHKRILEMTGLDYTKKSNFHAQHWQKIAHCIPSIFYDILPQKNYDCIVSHSLYLGILLSPFYTDKGMELADYFFEQFVTASEKLYAPQFLQLPNVHAEQHLMEDTKHNKFPAHILMVQRHEKHHQISKFPLQKKKGVSTAWVFNDYAIKLQENITSSKLNVSNILVSNNGNYCIRYYNDLKEVKKQEKYNEEFKHDNIESESVPNFIGQTKLLKFTMDRKLKKGKWLIKGNKAMRISKILQDDKFMLYARGKIYNLKESTIIGCKLIGDPVRATELVPEPIAVWCLHDCTPVKAYTMNEIPFINVMMR
ncbi:MAG: hypothetical protein H0U27_13365, partial [Nitrosopumilus sp.]|nr:hypothetical protein [Nitrosopumilus sp.]